MSGYRTQTQIRNYDIFKGIFLLLLIGATAVSVVIAGGDSGDVAQARDVLLQLPTKLPFNHVIVAQDAGDLG